MAVITLSRALGSGGTDVANLVANALGYRFISREIVDMVSARLGVSPESAKDLDERVLGWLSSIVDSVLRSAQGEALTAESYRYVAARVLREIAREDNVVILGRAGQAVLAKFPNSLHVHITAPFAVRVQRVQTARGITKQEARRIVEDSDQQRRAYIMEVAQADWADPLLYDLVVNTSRLSIEAAADTVLAAARHRGARLKE